MSGSLLQQAERFPATYAIAFAYLALALLTNPLDPSNEALIRFGGAVGYLVGSGEPWRLVTHAFLHGGLIHLLFNTYALIAIGPPLELSLRTPRFVLVYLVSAVFGGVVGCLWHSPLAPLVGGSGALFGMMGALVARQMRHGRHLLDFMQYHGPRQLVVLIAINLVLGWMIPQVSNAAHIGGLIAGFALTFFFLDPGRREPDRLDHVIRAGWIALGLGLLLYVMVPVLRFDWLMRQRMQAQSPAQAQAYQEALDESLHPADQEVVRRWIEEIERR